MSWLGCDLLYFTLHYITLHYINIQFLYTWCVTREEPHPKFKLIRKTFGASIRSALKTTNMPSEVTYNVQVGCNVPPCYII